MDQTAAGLMIATTALLMNGGLAEAALAEDASRLTLSHGPAALQFPPRATPTVAQTSGSRSERVLSLVLALEALRAAPDLLDTPKV